MKRTNAQKIDTEVESLISLGKGGGNEIGSSDRSNKIRNLEYIGDMLGELRIIAKTSNELPLVYFLEMAIMEAGEAGDVLKFRHEKSEKS